MTMSRYWSRLTRKTDPYVPGEQPKDRKYIKLNTNENPYPPSPKALEAMAAAMESGMQLYPDPTGGHLVETIAGHYGLHAGQVFVGNGSDEVLGFAFMAFFDPDRPILYPDITYSFYPVYAKVFNIPYELVPLEEDFSIPVEALLRPSGGVIFANPNAPTGKALSLDAIERILEANMDQVVIVDEAYVDFGCDSAVPLIERFPNLLVVQTLSKSRSLAGLRVGYAMGHPHLIEGLNRIKNSFNSYTIDRVAMAGAAAAIEDDAYFREMTGKIIRTREKTVAGLKDMGFHVIESAANFIFAAPPSKDAARVYTALRENGILVRYFNKPRIDGYLRISIGSEEEMDKFLDTIRRII